MPPRKGGRMADAPAAEPAAPPAPYRIANEALFIYDPDSGALPARAFNEGDRVPIETVENYGWHDLTHDPEWASAPPAPAPDTGPPDHGGSGSEPATAGGRQEQ
jgi:hypothetical protein